MSAESAGRVNDRALAAVLQREEGPDQAGHYNVLRGTGTAGLHIDQGRQTRLPAGRCA